MPDLRAKGVTQNLVDRAHIAARLSNYTLRDFIIAAVSKAVKAVEAGDAARRRTEEKTKP